jgi:hypothetical protein
VAPGLDDSRLARVQPRHQELVAPHSELRTPDLIAVFELTVSVHIERRDAVVEHVASSHCLLRHNLSHDLCDTIDGH